MNEYKDIFEEITQDEISQEFIRRDCGHFNIIMTSAHNKRIVVEIDGGISFGLSTDTLREILAKCDEFYNSNKES